ncbi:MAG: anthranilate synthase component I, partial [Coleofasciculaceae cyanobacterium]
MPQTNYRQKWHWRSLPLNNRTGSEIFESLFLSAGNIATLLESPPPTSESQPQLARYSICAGTPRLKQGTPQMWTPAVGKILPFLNNLLSQQ